MHINILGTLAICAAYLPTVARANPPYYWLKIFVDDGKVSNWGGAFHASELEAGRPHYESSFMGTVNWAGWKTTCDLKQNTSIKGVVELRDCIGYEKTTLDAKTGVVSVNGKKDTNGVYDGKAEITRKDDGSIGVYDWRNVHFVEDNGQPLA